MNVDLTQLALAVVPAVLASWLTYQLGIRQGRQERERQRREAAVTALAEPLRALRALVRRHGRVHIAENEVPDAFAAWFDAFDHNRTRVPDHWRHLSRSIRAATGTVFGAASFVDIRPDAASEPLADPDFVWQDFADDYIDYVLDAVTRWGDDYMGAYTSLMDYDTWLKKTDRQPARSGRSRP